MDVLSTRKHLKKEQKSKTKNLIMKADIKIPSLFSLKVLEDWVKRSREIEIGRAVASDDSLKALNILQETNGD